MQGGVHLGSKSRAAAGRTRGNEWRQPGGLPVAAGLAEIDPGRRSPGARQGRWPELAELGAGPSDPCSDRISGSGHAGVSRLRSEGRAADSPAAGAVVLLGATGGGSAGARKRRRSCQRSRSSAKGIRTMTVVRTTYRYKRPPRKRKAVALEVPAIVRAADPAKASKRTPLRDQRSGEPTPDLATTAPANDDRKSAIVTARRPGRRAVATCPT